MQERVRAGHREMGVSRALFKHLVMFPILVIDRLKARFDIR
jgi:hypothetical protein